ncbi:1,6-anhydro-N-acetylmuramyl-L-alanine amidase AmpD [bacterium]|nr:1,6-anhydro-N-acetylmuramyl-L-alanine amidase AmpD [bacterium]
MTKTKIQIQEGWLSNARRCESPNYDQRPDGVPIDLLVIHNISLPPGEYGNHYIEDFFCNCLARDEHPYFQTIEGLCVSSHVLIKRDGEIVQFVPFNQRAWHAGQSHFDGRDRCNDFSIGIEMEGSDYEAFTPRQYEVLQELTGALMANYPGITRDRIVGHSDIAPERKTDPGPYFFWSQYLDALDV